MRPPARFVGIGVQVVLGLLWLYGLISLRGLAARWGFSLTGMGVFLLWCGVATLGVPLLRATPSRRRLVMLAVAAMLARALFALLSAGHVFSGDPHSYLTLASGLLAYHELGIYEPWFGSYWRALFPPLYPLLLAGWGAIAGFSPASVLLLGTAIDAMAAWLIARLGARLGSPGAGRGAAWLYLIWPSVLFSAPLAQKEGLCVVLIIALAIAWLDRRPGWRGAVAIGVPAALLALTQPGEAPIAPLFGFAMLGEAGLWAILSTGLRAAVIAALVMLPWWIRNWLVFGMFVPLTSAGEASLWVGNNPDATGNWLPPPPQLHGLPEIIYGRRIGTIAMTWIIDHPAAFLRLTLTKFARAAGVGEFGLVRLSAMRPPLSAALSAALLPLAQLTHLAMLGLSALAARARPAPGSARLILLIAACGVQMMAFGVWFEFGERHREFATPFLLLLLCRMVAPADIPVGNAAPAP